MKFSIIIPSYNQGKFIERTIDSILLSQQGVDLEILVYDGGSTDRTIEILKSYGDQIQWVSERNRGRANAINQGLSIVSGDVHCYLNSGDVFYSGALKKVADAFKNNPNSRILYGDADHIDENDLFIEHYYNEPWDYKRLLDTCFICQPATFWRKEITLEYGLLDDSLHYAMDYEYWLRVGSQEPLLYLEGERLAASRRYAENKKISQRVSEHREILKIIRYYTKTPYCWLKILADIEHNEKGDFSYIVNFIRLSSEYAIPLDGVILSELMSKCLPVFCRSGKYYIYENNRDIFDKINAMSRYNLFSYSLIKKFIFGLEILLNFLQRGICFFRNKVS